MSDESTIKAVDSFEDQVNGEQARLDHELSVAQEALEKAQLARENFTRLTNADITALKGRAEQMFTLPHEYQSVWETKLSAIHILALCKDLAESWAKGKKEKKEDKKDDTEEIVQPIVP